MRGFEMAMEPKTGVELAAEVFSIYPRLACVLHS
jgi:hypothetical protein